MTEPSKNMASFTEYLGRAVTLYAENFTIFLNFSFACVAPTVIKSLLDGAEDANVAVLGLLLGPLVFCVYTFFTMCLTYVVASLGRGQGLSAREAMGHVRARFLRGTGGYLLLSFAVIAGLFLLVVPGIYCFTVLYFFIFEILLEDKGVVASLKRSHELVCPCFWRILAAHGVVFGLTALLFVPLIVGMGMIGIANVVSLVLMGVVAALVMPVFVAFYYFIYADIKPGQDGVINTPVKA